MRNLLMTMALASFSLCAQWLHYPTARVPKRPNGSPNLTAPAPRGADGKPDLSGVWAPPRNKPLDESLVGQTNPTGPFWNFGSVVQGGLPYQSWAAEIYAKRSGDNSRDNPDVRCMPLGILQMDTHPFPLRIVQVPGFITILFERNMEYRQIFTDGRPLLKDPQPSWNGYSTGKWAGDTLVVETNGFRNGLWADYNGSPITEAAKVTEKFHRVNFGTMEIEVTVEDLGAYTRPWTVKLTHTIVLDEDLLEYVCLEGEKDAVHMVGK